MLALSFSRLKPHKLPPTAYPIEGVVSSDVIDPTEWGWKLSDKRLVSVMTEQFVAGVNVKVCLFACALVTFVTMNIAPIQKHCQSVDQFRR